MLDSREDQVEENDNAEDKGISESKLDTSSETDIADDEAEQKQPQKISDEAGDKVSDKVSKTATSVSKKDYTQMGLEVLVDELEKLINNNPVQKIKTPAEEIKFVFSQKFGKLLKEKKEAFLAQGGNSIDFQFSSPIKLRYNKLMSAYKEKKDTYFSTLEKQLKENLEKRHQVIRDLKALIENADTKTMYKSFRELQKTWRDIGAVPKNKYNDTWKTYHHHVERFYDLLHLSNDFRDLDFKHNLEEKLKVIQRAEELSEHQDIHYAFKELQKLHKLWKEDIGPVGRDVRDEVWQKFSAATKKIHDKRHDYFREMKSNYGEIIEKKLAIVEEIFQHDFSKNMSHSDWQRSIDQINSLRQKYFDAGKLPFSKSEAVWQKFKTATKKFNQAKNLFYKQEKSVQQENLNKKLELIKLAESLKDSEDWTSATDMFKKIQSDWKKIGHVPRKFSDDIWKRFKAACNYYFDRYHQQKNALSPEQQEVVEDKKAFLERLKESEIKTKAEVDHLMQEWSTMGKLPRSARSIDFQFNKTINSILSNMSISKDEIAMLKFRNIINGYLVNNDRRKLDSERAFIRSKIDESVREIQQLENNLSFISNVSNDNPLVKNVLDSIRKFKEDLEIWRQKQHYLRTLDC